jgi:hypothetical protein
MDAVLFAADLGNNAFLPNVRGMMRGFYNTSVLTTIT